MSQMYFIPKLGALLKVIFIFLLVLFIIGFMGGFIIFHFFIPNASFVDFLLKVTLKEQFDMIIKGLPVFVVISLVCSFFVLINIIRLNDEGIRVQNIFTNNIFLSWDSIVTTKYRKLPFIGLKYLIIYPDKNSPKKIWMPLFIKNISCIEKIVSEKIRERSEET